MAHVKVYQGSSPGGSARLPWKNDTTVTGDWLARASIVNLPDLPAEARANCKEHKGNRDGSPVARQKAGQWLEELHM
jgi:hypothetical protein